MTYYGPTSSYYAPAYGPAAYTSSAYTSGQYYTPVAANIENTRLVAPQTNRNYNYQANQQYNTADSRDQQQEQQFDNGNRGAQKPAQTIHIHIETKPTARYTKPSGDRQYQDQYDRGNQFNRKGVNANANSRNAYAERMPYTNSGEQVKLRRYQVQRPGIQKEFYDVEERTIVRPAGSALIELDAPTKKQDITDYYQQPQPFNTDEQRNVDGNQQFAPQQADYDRNGAFYRVSDCGGDDDDDDGQRVDTGRRTDTDTGIGIGIGQNPQRPQYHPTTFTPPTNRFPTNNYPSGGFPTTVRPLEPRPNYPSYPTYPTYYPSYYPTQRPDVPNYPGPQTPQVW